VWGAGVEGATRLHGVVVVDAVVGQQLPRANRLQKLAGGGRYGVHPNIARDGCFRAGGVLLGRRGAGAVQALRPGAVDKSDA
jgi:hypothetical protein